MLSTISWLGLLCLGASCLSPADFAFSSFDRLSMVVVEEGDCGFPAVTPVSIVIVSVVVASESGVVVADSAVADFLQVEAEVESRVMLISNNNSFIFKDSGLGVNRNDVRTGGKHGFIESQPVFPPTRGIMI